MKAASAPVDTMRPDQLKPKRTLAIVLGKICREARQTAGLTQADVAANVGMVPEVYGRIERGQLLPSLPRLRRLCLFLKVDANAALKIDGHKHPPWMEAASGPSLDDSPRMRRLVRMMHQLDEEQLAAISAMTRVLVKQPHQRKALAKKEEAPTPDAIMG